jgi:hypothetical protein
VKNLCAADFLMGVYMAMIGAADAMFRGRYVQEERRWRQSALCRVAGVLGFVSSEMSALAICLITLDRLLVICLPLKSHLHLSRRAAYVWCLCCWLACLLLATVPVMLQLEFYDQNAICLPLPITRQQFSGRSFSFAVFIVTNFVLFLFVGCGQASVLVN